MRDHELELIAALVEGRLDDETEARALVASSTEHRDEYEAQKLAHETLQAAGPASLSEAERAALHRDIWTSLRAGTAAKPARTPWYLRWAPVAAGLFVVVGLVAVLNNQGGSDSSETLDLAADAPTETTAGAAATAGTDGEDRAADGEASEDPSTDEQATETTEAASEVPGTTTTEETGAASYSTEAASVRQGDFDAGRLESYDETGADASQIEACAAAALAGAGLGEYQVVATLELPPVGDATSTTSQQIPQVAVAIFEGADLSDTPVAFFDTGTCELVYLFE